MGNWFIRLTERGRTFAHILWVFFVFTTCVFSQSTNVPLNHWIYNLLERWQAMGYIEYTFEGSKPFSRMETAGYLKQVFTAYREHPQRFDRFDVQYLVYSSQEFQEELSQLQTPLPEASPVNRFRDIKEWPGISVLWPSFLYGNNRNFLSSSRRDFSLFVDPLAQVSRDKFLSSRDTVKTMNRTSNGFLFRGSLGGHLGFYFMLTDNHLRQEPPLNGFEVQRESGLPYLQFNDDRSADFDENVAYLTLSLKYVSFLYGRDYNQWGVGHSGNLILSTNAPVYDQLKFIVHYGRFKLTHITAALEYIPVEGRRRINQTESLNVYWSGNRVEAYAGKGINLGFSQSIVYGNRSLQPGYINPLAFFASIEHYYGDRDNGAFSLDFSWRMLSGLKIYGEWLVDDITTTKLGSDFFGNKFGYQAGVFWVDPLQFAGSDLLIEYTRIKPYVYSHSLQDYNKYKHYDTLLGHPIGPNSDLWYLRYRWQPHRRLLLETNFQYYRHGANPPGENVGGNPDLPYIYGDPQSAPFLAGDRVTRASIGGEIRYEALRNLFLRLRYHQIRSQSGKWKAVSLFQIAFNFGYRREPFPIFEPVLN